MQKEEKQTNTEFQEEEEKEPTENKSLLSCFLIMINFIK